MIALLPWTLRNRAITGHPIVTTLWVGPSLYDGLNPDATGDSDMRFFEHDNLLRSMSEYEMDRGVPSSRGPSWVRIPVVPCRWGSRKLLRYWKLWPNAERFVPVDVFRDGGPVSGRVWLFAHWIVASRHDFRCLLLTAVPVLYRRDSLGLRRLAAVSPAG